MLTMLAQCTMPDATKALDRVEYRKLFRLLASTDLPPLGLDIILICNSGTRIARNEICSATYFVANGVKQGAVMSPI